MATHGRRAEEKLWDTSFRHVFNTNFLKDPDLHILLFISESEVNNIIREALRDYMVKHQSKAIAREYQARVFMTASLQVAAGARPKASDVLFEMGEESARAAGPPRQPPARRNVAPTPLPAPVAQPTAFAPASPAAVVSQAPTEVAVAAAPVGQAHAGASDFSPTDRPAPAPLKPKVVLDFGPEPDVLEVALDVEAGPKVSQRDKWLARHKS